LGAALVFVVLVLVPALNLGEGLRKMLLAVFVETTAFLLAFKILIRRQPQRNSMIAVAFLGALALIVVKLGVAMLSSVLNSERAVQVNIAVMRPDGTAEDPTAADRVLTLCLMLP